MHALGVVMHCHLDRVSPPFAEKYQHPCHHDMRRPQRRVTALNVLETCLQNPPQQGLLKYCRLRQVSAAVVELSIAAIAASAVKETYFMVKETCAYGKRDLHTYLRQKHGPGKNKDAHGCLCTHRKLGVQQWPQGQGCALRNAYIRVKGGLRTWQNGSFS